MYAIGLCVAKILYKKITVLINKAFNRKTNIKNGKITTSNCRNSRPRFKI